MLQNVKKWIYAHRTEALILSVILLVASFLRLYKIADYMTFLGDEGRDAIVVRRLLVNFDPILVGPGTSIGNMYLGPLYYYLIAPFLLLFNFSPVGPSIMVALIGVITVFLVWHVGRIWFGRLAGIVAALLFATAPVVIIYSRSSWNPNIMPFFALLCIFSIWKVYKNYEFKWLIIFAISYAFVLNSHYLGLLLLPTVGLFWFLTYLKIHKSEVKNKLNIDNFIKYSLLGFGIFCILMSPLLIFDARHGWRNFDAVKTFFTVRQETVSVKPWTALPKIYSIWEKIILRLVTATKEPLSAFVASLTTMFVAIYTLRNINNLINIYKFKVQAKLTEYALLFVWLLVTLVGFGVYKQEIYDHYYGIIFPAVFLLIGALFQELFNRNRVLGSVTTVFFVTFLLYQNVINSPINYPPNKQMQRTQDVAYRLEELSEGREFNFAVIAERNYEGAYQYFLEKDNVPFVIIDPQRSDETIKDQLFVICELPSEKCDPTNNAKTEIANFGWSKIDFQEHFSGVTIYKLVHY